MICPGSFAARNSPNGAAYRLGPGLMSPGISGCRLMLNVGGCARSGEGGLCYQVVRWRRKPIILHGCRGCGAKFNFTARSDLNLKPSCNVQSVLLDLGWADDRDIRRNCQTIPESCRRSWVLVYDKVVLGGPCAETPPLTSQTPSIYLQRLNPSETSFRTQGVSQRSEHDTPYLCKSIEWPNGGPRLVAGGWKRKKKQRKSNYGTCIGAGPKGDGTHRRTKFPGVFDRIV